MIECFSQPDSVDGAVSVHEANRDRLVVVSPKQIDRLSCVPTVGADLF